MKQSAEHLKESIKKSAELIRESVKHSKMHSKNSAVPSKHLAEHSAVPSKQTPTSRLTQPQSKHSAQKSSQLMNQIEVQSIMLQELRPANSQVTIHDDSFQSGISNKRIVTGAELQTAPTVPHRLTANIATD
jgi:hypothetical protein